METAGKPFLSLDVTSLHWARLARYRTVRLTSLQHLRCCPHCGRAVEKLRGCDWMKCGEDYHGGNKQQGCGKSYKWTAAPPYRSSDSAFLMEKPLAFVKDEVKTHHGEFVRCDICQSEDGITGILFQCIHCPCFNVCEGCEEDLVHVKDHVFDIKGVQFLVEELDEDDEEADDGPAVVVGRQTLFRRILKKFRRSKTQARKKGAQEADPEEEVDIAPPPE